MDKTSTINAPLIGQDGIIMTYFTCQNETLLITLTLQLWQTSVAKACSSFGGHWASTSCGNQLTHFGDSVTRLTWFIHLDIDRLHTAAVCFELVQHDSAHYIPQTDRAITRSSQLDWRNHSTLTIHRYIERIENNKIISLN